MAPYSGLLGKNEKHEKVWRKRKKGKFKCSGGAKGDHRE